MEDIKKGDIRKVIRESLDLEPKKGDLNESVRATPKTYNLNTELILTKTKDAHKELYGHYIESFNQASAELDSADRKSSNSEGSEYRAVKIDEQYNMNACYLHELYFANISDPYSEVNLDSFAHMRLTRDFGTFDDWQRDFIACANAARGGWVVTALSTYLKRYVNFIVDDHTKNVLVGTYPVIALDMFEHARRDYLNHKQEYVKAMMRELNWNVIEERFKRADLILQAIS
jgi:Fe-Mn family superoxide dismutase